MSRRAITKSTVEESADMEEDQAHGCFGPPELLRIRR